MVFFRGEEGQLFEAVFPPLPYDPSPLRNAAKGVSPLETPAGFLGAEAPKRREEVGRGLRRGAEKLLRTVSPPLS